MQIHLKFDRSHALPRGAAARPTRNRLRKAAWWSLGFALTTAVLAAPGEPAARIDASAAMPKRGNARFYELHSTHLKRAKAGPIGLLFLGDSITERWTQVPEIWEASYGKYQPANFGIGGDQTQHVLWRLEDGVLDGLHPKVVVLLLGTNNTSDHTAEQIAAADAKIVRLIRAKIPETKILLLGIFPRGPRINRQGVVLDDAVHRMKVITEANRLLARLDDGRTVRFLDFGARFQGPDGKIPSAIMPDQVHLSPEGYRIWVEAMQPLLEEMLRCPEGI